MCYMLMTITHKTNITVMTQEVTVICSTVDFWLGTVAYCSIFL